MIMIVINLEELFEILFVFMIVINGIVNRNFDSIVLFLTKDSFVITTVFQ